MASEGSMNHENSTYSGGIPAYIQSELQSHLDSVHPCIVCGGAEFEPWAAQGYLTAQRCRACGMISVNPHFTEAGLQKFYSMYFQHHRGDDTKNKQREAMYLIDRDWVSRYVPGGKVLDVGCSGGYFLNTFSPDTWDRHGVEIDPNAAQHARATFGLPVRTGLFAQMDFGDTYDLVMMRGVIEHFKDPIPVLRKCADILSPGGFLYLTATPAGDSFAFDVYREKWRLFTPFEHIHFFTVGLLTRMLHPLGFIEVAHHYQYQETPYADPQKDYAKMKHDIIERSSGRQIGESGPFPGSMITALWRKSA